MELPASFEIPMANPIDTACPSCATVLRVPVEFAGKKVKCKTCNAVFPVPVPVKALPAEFAKPGTAKPAKPAKPIAAKPAALPPPTGAPLNFAADDEDDNNPYTSIKENEAPRCPHCAKDMDPPDAAICLNCGYDLRVRQRKESRNVIEHTFLDYVKHHSVAVLLVLLAIGLNVGAIVCWMYMTSWVGPWLETEEVNDASKAKNHYVKPWCFSLWIEMMVIWASWKCLKFAFKRFFKEPRPPEKIVKKKVEFK